MNKSSKSDACCALENHLKPATIIDCFSHHLDTCPIQSRTIKDKEEHVNDVWRIYKAPSRYLEKNN